MWDPTPFAWYGRPKRQRDLLDQLRADRWERGKDRIGIGTVADGLVDRWISDFKDAEREARDPLVVRRRQLRQVATAADGWVRGIDVAIRDQERCLTILIEAKAYPSRSPTLRFNQAHEYAHAILDGQARARALGLFDQRLAHLNAIAVVRRRDAELNALVNSIRSADDDVVAPWLLSDTSARDDESPPSSVEHALPRETRAGPTRSDSENATEDSRGDHDRDPDAPRSSV